MQISNELKLLIPALAEEEKELLTNSIIKEGCREPLITWNDTLVDGHNRYDICEKYKIPYKTVVKEFEDKNAVKVWMIKNQLGRRNLTQGQKCNLTYPLKSILEEQARKNLKLAGENFGENHSRQEPFLMSEKALVSVIPKSLPPQPKQPEPPKPIIKPVNTTKIIAKEAGVSTDTMSKFIKIKEKAKPEIVQKVIKGDISINEGYKQVKKEEKKEERVQKIVEISKGNEDLKTDKTYPVIYADPPWKYDFSKDSADDVENHYPTMTHEEICKMPLDKIAAKDCVLYMWATAPKLIEAIEVLKAWGFTYKTNAIWDKQHIGMGYWFRGQHELLLVATKGNIPIPEFKVSSVYAEKRTRHSKKPDYYYEIIEKMFPEFNKIELFCREAKEGWDAWGNQSK